MRLDMRIGQMAPHQKQREQGALLVEATNALKTLNRRSTSHDDAICGYCESDLLTIKKCTNCGAEYDENGDHEYRGPVNV